MKKKTSIFLTILCILTLVIALGACTGNAKKLTFNEDTYSIYMDDVTKITPSVTISPKKGVYFLVSNNPAIVSIAADGITVQANKVGIAVVSAFSNKDTTLVLDTANIIVYTTKNEGSDIIAKNTHTVMFETGFSSIPNQEVIPGKCAVVPESPLRPDQVIAAWYTDKELTKLFDFTTPITAQTILYAKWIVKGEPTFLYKTSEKNVYIAGLAYPAINYGHINLPITAPDGKNIYGIAEGAFQNNNVITSVTIPSTYVTINKRAFFKCEKLESVVFSGSGLEIISKDAFNSCIALTSLNIPSTVITIDEYAFSGCSKFALGELPSTLKVISEGAFYGTATTSVNLQYVTNLGFMAFKNSKDLATVTNAKALTEISSEVFYGTEFLRKAIDVTTAKEGGVAYLEDVIVYASVPKSTTTVYIRETTRLIASAAFKNITISKTLVFSSATPPKADIGCFSSEFTDIIVPKSYLNAYMESWGKQFYSNLFYEDTLDGILSVLVSKSDNTAQAVPVIIIKKYSDKTATQANIKEILYRHYTDDVQIKIVKTGAFNNLPKLTTVILPPIIKKMEVNALSELQSFSTLIIDGKYPAPSIYQPADTKLAQSFINTLQPNPKWLISVPKAYLAAYQQGWSIVSKKFVGV